MGLLGDWLGAGVTCGLLSMVDLGASAQVVALGDATIRNDNGLLYFFGKRHHKTVRGDLVGSV